MKSSPIWLAALGLLLASGTAHSQEQRPNFIIFLADDMAWDDCGAYGHKHIRTPNIDQLARDGLRFDAAFLTCSSCSPSRSSILTGRYPHSTGAEQLHWPLPADQVTFVETLREAGYWTASAGKWHLGADAKKRFDRIEERQSGAWQQVIKERPLNQPFFLWMAFYDPHRDYQKGTIPVPHKPSDAAVPPYLPDVYDTREDLAMYYDEITRLDGVVGEVLAELKRQGAEQDTLVLFMSDNGRPFPRDKTTLLDGGIKTPFIIRFPGRVEPGTTSPRLVSAVDIAPTILELAGVAPPATLQGKSLAPLLRDPEEKIRDFIYAERHWHDFTGQERAVRSERFKYIRNYHPELPRTPPADAVRSPTFRAMKKLRDANQLTPAQMDVFVAPRPEEELYDIQADPYELNNLAGDPAYKEALQELRTALISWQRETRDALPREVTPDEFDRETGQRLANWQANRRARPEIQAGQDEP